MKDKSILQILIECLIGVLLMLPLSIFNSDNMMLNAVGKVLYSFGIMLAMMKLMSLVYRMVSCLFREVMLSHQKSYWILYVVFICLGVVVWNLFSGYFGKGYFAAEIIAYAVFAFWFFLDINTTKCFTYIGFLDMILSREVKKHEEYVDTYKKEIRDISRRKNTLVKELEQFFPKKFLKDPLKDLRREPDFARLNMYIQKKPLFQGSYKGIVGLLSGQRNINKFENDIECYLGSLVDDEHWMENEKVTYGGYIVKMEKIVTNIKNSGKNVETLGELGFNTDKYQKILEGDIMDAGNNRKNIRQFWKMNKKINKMRRKNYGR